jgi:ligand-binding sensor domain-containing protein
MIRCGITLTLLITLYCNLSFAQQLPVRYLGIEQGLSNDAVLSIFQDHNGFFWFGTYDGLNRYDGYRFKVYHNVIGDSTSMASFSRVRYIPQGGAVAILQDNVHLVKVIGKGCILVGTQHEGLIALARSDRNGVQVLPEQRGGPTGLTAPAGATGPFDVTAIERTRDNKVWVFIAMTRCTRSFNW